MPPQRPRQTSVATTRRRHRAWIAPAAAALLALAPSVQPLAQGTQPGTAQSAQATPPKLPPPPPASAAPYDADLLQLSEIMGALHFLEQLCDGQGTSAWRDQMSALLDAEQPDDQRRARLVDAFNRGFEGYRAVYRQCTDSAELAIMRYEDEGAKIAANLDAKYGRGG
jgi:uncharacterized protein (TIGR02301 family)